MSRHIAYENRRDGVPSTPLEQTGHFDSPFLPHESNREGRKTFVREWTGERPSTTRDEKVSGWMGPGGTDVD